MVAAGAVDVEEEGWVRAVGRKRGKVDEFLVPAFGVRGTGVGGGEEMREAWVVGRT